MSALWAEPQPAPARPAAAVRAWLTGTSRAAENALADAAAALLSWDDDAGAPAPQDADAWRDYWTESW